MSPIHIYMHHHNKTLCLSRQQLLVFYIKYVLKQTELYTFHLK